MGSLSVAPEPTQDPCSGLYVTLTPQHSAGQLTIGSCLKALHTNGFANIAGADDIQKLRTLVKYGIESQNETQKKIAKKIAELVINSPLFSEVEKEERTAFLKASSGFFLTWIGELGRRCLNYFRYGYRASQDIQRILAQAATNAFAVAIEQKKGGEEFIDAFTRTYNENTKNIPGAQKFLNAFLTTITSDTGLFEREPEEETPVVPTAPYRRTISPSHSPSPIQEEILREASDEAQAMTMSLGKGGLEFISTYSKFYNERTRGIPGAQEFLDTSLAAIIPNLQLLEKVEVKGTISQEGVTATPPHRSDTSRPQKPSKPEREPLSEGNFRARIPSIEARVLDPIDQIVTATKKRTPPSTAPQDYREYSPQKMADEEAQCKVEETTPVDPEGSAKTIYSKLQLQQGFHYEAFSREFASLTNQELKYLVRYALAALCFPNTRDFETAKTILREYNKTVIKALHDYEYRNFAREELLELLDKCKVDTDKDIRNLRELKAIIGALE